jgi:hypothetical protein
LLSCAFVSTFYFGCATKLDWPTPKRAHDFQRAEDLQERTGKSLLLVYLDSRSTMDKPMKAALRDHEVRERLKDMVECRLFRANEDDRRYAAQFRVERAPSLVLVHQDGTYHAYSDAPTASGILRFLDESRSPGQTPVHNSLIHRSPRYAWQNDLSAALQQATESNREALVVLYRGGTRDWPRVEDMLDRAEVFRRFDGMVHVRVTGLMGAPKDEMGRYGVSSLPALVIVRPDGSSEKLEMPTSFEAIIRFADGAKHSEISRGETSMSSASS